jgi:predicted site-specific integrase-resolvase
MFAQLLIPVEVDRLLRYRAGTAERLARKGKLPHVTLPDGSIRFIEVEIEALLKPQERKEVVA